MTNERILVFVFLYLDKSKAMKRRYYLQVTGKRSCSPTYHNPAGELDTCMINTKDESPKYIIKKTVSLLKELSILIYLL